MGRMVYFEDVITTTGKVLEKMEGENRIRCAVEAKEQRGELKIRGSFEVELPSRGQRGRFL